MYWRAQLSDVKYDKTTTKQIQKRERDKQQPLGASCTEFVRGVGNECEMYYRQNAKMLQERERQKPQQHAGGALPCQTKPKGKTTKKVSIGTMK
jgi:hypothetical protein